MIPNDRYLQTETNVQQTYASTETALLNPPFNDFHFLDHLRSLVNVSDARRSLQQSSFRRQLDDAAEQNTS